MKLHRRTLRRDGASGIRAVVTTRRQARCLPGRIDTSDVHRYRGEPRGAQHEHGDQAGDAEGCLDRGTAGLTD